MDQSVSTKPARIAGVGVSFPLVESQLFDDSDDQSRRLRDRSV